VLSFRYRLEMWREDGGMTYTLISHPDVLAKLPIEHK
jgi:hypothetical protein